MRRDRKIQMLSIVALVLAIIGMSLGFAAFSSTLSISSSATVTPNSDDFKMVVYGLIDDEEKNALLLGETLDFSKWSLVEVPDINNYGSTAVIDNNNLTINNINVSFSKPGCNTAYIVAIKNEGMYDAYLDLDKYKPIIASNCVSNGDATQNLVDDACIGISLTLSFYNSSYEIISSGILKVEPNSYMGMFISVSYAEGSAVADGDFSVEFDDIELEFTTAPPSN